MEESTKITYMKNLETFSFANLITTPVNSNADIKTIINVDSYIFDEKIDCGSGKAIYSGKVGVKILYVDTDNLTNTLTDTQTFSETIVNPAITSDTFVSVCNPKIFSSVDIGEGLIKISSEISVRPVMYLNLGIPCVEHNFEHLVAKKSNINTTTISQFVNTEFAYTTVYEANEKIDKILCCQTAFKFKSALAYDEYALVEGELLTKLLYEVSTENGTQIKQANITSLLKKEVSLPGLNNNEKLDLCFKLLCDKDTISSEIEDEKTIVTLSQSIAVRGVSLKEISLEVVDDMFSVQNEIEVNFCSREYCLNITTNTATQNVFGEIDLTETDATINEVVATISSTPEITNMMIKDGEVWVEGIVGSCVLYTDDNNNYCSKQTELPFSFNTKIVCEQLDGYHFDVCANNTKTRAKRGTTLEVEYELTLTLLNQQRGNTEFVDNFTLGKDLDFSKYDFQIFIAKKDETMWDLCKRTKIHPDDILKYNNSLPPICLGGERIIVKR